MADRYWVGGTDTWNAAVGSKWSTTSGGAGGASVPTAADDVYIDAASGSGTITATTAASFCRSLNFTGFTGTFSYASQTISIGDGTAGAGNNALTIGSGMNFTSNSISTFALISTSATQQTITTNGKTINILTINGAGSSYILADALTTANAFNCLAGTFDTANYSLTVGSLNYGNATARTLTLGSSAITITGSSAFTGSSNVNLTVTANTAVATLTNNSPSLNFTTNNSDWGGLSFVHTGVGQVTITSATSNTTTIGDLTVTPGATKLGVVSLAGNLTLGTLTLNSNSDVNKILVQSSVPGTARTLTATSVAITNTVDFIDITGAGPATWTAAGTGATYLGDGQGNSGITFTTPAAQTMSAGGSWSDPTKWTSRIPLPQDDVTVTGSSAVTIDVQRLGKDIDFSGYSGTATWTSSALTYHVFGSVTLGSSVSWGTAPNTGYMTLAGRGTHTITSNGIPFFPAGSNGLFTVTAPGGSYTLTDNLDIDSPTTCTFVAVAGSFYSANYTIDVGRITATGANTRTVDFGTSTVNLKATGGITLISTTTTGLTSGFENATFVVSNITASTRSLDLGGVRIGTFTYTVAGSTGTLGISSSGRIDTLNFSDATNARILQLSAGVMLTTANFNVFGTAGKLVTVKSATTAIARISKPSGGALYDNAQDYIAYEYIQVVQPLSLWLNTNSTALGCIAIYATAPTYRHKQSTFLQSGASGSLSNSFIEPTTAGNLLIAYIHSAGATGGSEVYPSGWTQAVQELSGSPEGFIYYKVADGSETSVAYSQVTTRQIIIWLVEYSGFTGTPTLDVTDANYSGTSTASLSTGSGVTNTDQPALAVAFVGANSTLATLQSLTNSFVQDYSNVTNTTTHVAVKELTTTAPVDTTFTWVTGRANVSTMLAVFRSVATAKGNFFELF